MFENVGLECDVVGKHGLGFVPQNEAATSRTAVPTLPGILQRSKALLPDRRRVRHTLRQRM